MALSEYHPELMEMLDSTSTQPVLTANEREILAVIRKANPEDPKVTTDAQRKLLQGFAELLAPG